MARDLAFLLRLRYRSTSISDRVRAEFVIGSFNPEASRWIVCNRGKRDVVTFLFFALLRGERYDVATFMQKTGLSRNTVTKYLRDSCELGLAETSREGNTNYYCGARIAWDNFVLSAEEERFLISRRDRKKLTGFFRDLAGQAVATNTLGLKTAADILLYLRVNLLSQSMEVVLNQKEPKALALIASYPSDWIRFAYSSPITTDVILLALSAKVNGETLNLSQIKNALRISANTLRGIIKISNGHGILETETRGRQVLVRASDFALETFLSNYRAGFLTLGPQDLHILADFFDI